MRQEITVPAWVQESKLADIAEKVVAGERLSFDDGVRLFRSPELLVIGWLANVVRRRKNGSYAYFIVNRHINHTNVCVNLCRLCAFGKKAEDAGAYTLTPEEIEEKVRQCQGLGISEVHIVGGLNPELKLDYYLDVLRRVKRVLPQVVVQSFTAVEVDYLARQEGTTVDEILRLLMEAGLDSLPGGGAEIFSPRVRQLICPNKISGERWLEVHRAAHRLGMRTNATMLYGHVETIEERVDHLLQLRALQDETGGFLAFIPLAFHPHNTELGRQVNSSTTGYDDLKVLAIARLLLDNFDHIKAFWIMIGPKLAQVSLSFGVDDLDGTVVEERIVHEAGAQTAQAMARAELVRLIKSAGFIPVERDTLYRIIKVGE